MPSIRIQEKEILWVYYGGKCYFHKIVYECLSVEAQRR